MQTRLRKRGQNGEARSVRQAVWTGGAGRPAVCGDVWLMIPTVNGLVLLINGLLRTVLVSVIDLAIYA